MRTGIMLMAACTAAVISSGAADASVLEVSGTSLSEEDVAKLNGNEVTELWKTGEGTLLSQNIPDFTGVIRVKAGILKVVDSTGLGKKGNGGDTYVESGATLEFALTAGIYYYPGETLHLSGTGTDGKGAVYVSAGDTYLGRFRLTDDALVTSDVTFHLFEEPIDMNGKTLTVDLKDSGRSLQLKPSSITSPGHLVMEKGILSVESDLEGDGSNTITVKGGATLKVSGPVCNWKAILPASDSGSSGQLSFAKDGEPRDLSYDGAIVYEDGFDGVTGSWTTGEWGYMRMAFNGPISGEGSFYSRFLYDPRKGDHFIELNNTNTFTGTLHVKECTALRARYPESIPDITNVQFPSAVANYNQLVLDLASDENPAGWTGTKLSDALKYFNRTDLPDSRVLVGAREGEAGVATGLVFGAGNQIVLGAIGPGTVKLRAEFRNDNLLVESPMAPLTLSATEDTSWGNAFTAFRVLSGQCVFEDAGFVPFGTLSLKVGSHPDYYKTARLTVAEGSVLSCDYPESGATPTAAFKLGETGQGHDGIIETAGGIITNNLKLGTSMFAAGALYVNGGEFFSTGKWGDATEIGLDNASGHGYVEVNAGTFTSYGACHLGCKQGAKGILYQTGGLVRLFPDAGYQNLLEVGFGGTGVVYQTGGTLDVSGSKHMIINGSSYGGKSAHSLYGSGVVTLDGPGARLSAKRIVMGERKGEAVLNVLDGATLETGYVFHNKYQIYVESYGDENRAHEGEITDDVEYVNFDGGIFKCAEGDDRSTDIFSITFREEDETRPKFVTVHSGGMTVDTAGEDRTLSAPLLVPKAGGVVSLSLPDDAEYLDGYITAPLVEIKGGGQGATAVAIFDSASGRVTGVKVTSPGWGYVQGAVTATLSQCGQRPKTAVELGVTVGDPATTGGFTKRGEGTLTLTAANEILGPVKVEGGTLTVAAGASIASVEAVEVAAGASLVVEDGATYAPSSVKGSGTVSGLDSVGLASDWTLDAADIAEGRYLSVGGTLAVPENCVLHVTGLSELPKRAWKLAKADGGITGSLPSLGEEFDDPHWTVVKENGGTELTLRYVRGTVVILR